MLTNFETGRHVDLPGVELIPVKAFRLEPKVEKREEEDGSNDAGKKRKEKSAGGFMTVDGEQVEYGPIQAEVLPSFVRIVAG